MAKRRPPMQTRCPMTSSRRRSAAATVRGDHHDVFRAVDVICAHERAADDGLHTQDLGTPPATSASFTSVVTPASTTETRETACLPTPATCSNSRPSLATPSTSRRG